MYSKLFYITDKYKLDIYGINIPKSADYGDYNFV